jgi:hypothetical protein
MDIHGGCRVAPPGWMSGGISHGLNPQLAADGLKDDYIK